MSTFFNIFSIALGAILIENYVLVQFLGICPFLGVSKKMDSAAGMGMAVIFVMTVASIFTWLANEFLLIPFELEYMRTIAFILIIASIVQLVELFLKKAVPALYGSLGIYLPLITTNCAVLGVALLNAQNRSASFGFLESTFSGFFAAVGFALALMLFASVRERLRFSDYPKAFEGFPIALVTASLMALAFMGFQGLEVVF